jgi:Tfp pilus assembly protein PilV
VTARGGVLVEALVAAALAGVAVAALCHTVVGTGRAVAAARRASTAVALAEATLDMLRVGPRADGADTPVGADGTPYVRSWAVAGGRGAPATLAVRVTSGGRTLALDGAVWP